MQTSGLTERVEAAILEQVFFRIQTCQHNACRIAVGVLPVQRLKACVNALTSW